MLHATRPSVLLHPTRWRGQERFSASVTGDWGSQFDPPFLHLFLFYTITPFHAVDSRLSVPSTGQHLYSVLVPATHARGPLSLAEALAYGMGASVDQVYFWLGRGGLYLSPFRILLHPQKDTPGHFSVMMLLASLRDIAATFPVIQLSDLL